MSARSRGSGIALSTGLLVLGLTLAGGATASKPKAIPLVAKAGLYGSEIDPDARAKVRFTLTRTGRHPGETTTYEFCAELTYERFDQPPGPIALFGLPWSNYSVNFRRGAAGSGRTADCSQFNAGNNNPLTGLRRQIEKGDVRARMGFRSEDPFALTVAQGRVRLAQASN